MAASRLVRIIGRALLGLTFIGWAGSGCSLDHRAFLQVDTARGANQPGLGNPGASPSQLGAECSDAAKCDSGFCVDGVCCAEACTDLCATCNAPGAEGQCVAASSDVACPDLHCGQDTDCASYDRDALAFNCAGYGKCQPAANCVIVDQPAGAACRAGAGVCNGEGSCSVAGKKLLAAACSNDGECAEGHCVAAAGGGSICCDTACDGVCEQCSASGRCIEAPPTDAACPAVACPADNVCRDYAEGLAGGACRGFDQCATAADCTFTALLPPTACQCDTASHCVLVGGQPCANAADCASGACVAGADGAPLCCALACDTGLFCSHDGSACVECEGSAVECQGATARSCNGGRFAAEDCSNGCTPGVGCNALPGVGAVCPAGQCQDGATCQADVAGVARCCVRDCSAEGKLCAANGSCVCAAGQSAGATGCLSRVGDPCDDATQCQAGLACTDGVCCGSACAGACERCNVPGSVGQCVFDAQDSAQCSGSQECAAQEQCLLRQAARCTTDSLCHSGHCEPLAGVPGAQACCAVACGADAPFCSSDGSHCVACASNADCANGCNTTTGICNALQQLGQVCTQPTQCATQACLTDASAGNVRRCCPANCAAGQLCNAQGQCINPPGGAGATCDPSRTCQAGLFCVDGVCCTSRCDGACQQCDSRGACSIAPSTDSACPALNCGGAATCQLATAPSPGQCAGFGRCAQCQTSTAPVGTACDVGGDSGSCGARAECLFYDPGTQCTVGGTTMHCCPTGSAMTGARVDQNAFKCVPMPNVSGAPFLDTATQRNDMHACPLGSVMIGLRDDLNQLACQFPGASVTSEFVDGNPATQDGFPMHVCGNEAFMTGVRVDANLFTCGL